MLFACALTAALCSCASYKDPIVYNVRPLTDGSIELEICTMQFGGQQVDTCHKVRRWPEPAPHCLRVQEPWRPVDTRE
jgi:hypothetical protein